MSSSLSTAPQSASRDPLPASWVERIFQRLHGRFGNQFFDKFRAGQLNARGDDVGIENAKQVWAEELAGMTPDEIKRGLGTAFKFAPACDEFRAACRPPIDYDAAYQEAVIQLRLRDDGNDVWSHPAIYWAAAAVGQFDILSCAYHHIKARWTKALDIELAKREWPQIPPRMIALPAPGKTTVSTEQAAENIARLKAMLSESRIAGKASAA